MNHTSSFWAATSNGIKSRPSLKQDMETDVVIIGAGFTGLATSYYLNKQGVKTIVLEKNSVGWGASGRNAGMLLTGYKESIPSIAKKWGIDDARGFINLSLDGINLVAQIVKDHDIECSLSHCGSMTAAYKPKHFDRIKRNHEYMNSTFNYPTILVDKDQLKDELGSSLYHGGLIDPHSHSFHPLNYAIGLADVVEELGGVIFEQTEVTSIKKGEQKVTVNTPNAKITAKEIVIATNGYTTNINKKLTKSIIPIGSYIIATEKLPEKVVKQLIPKNRMISDTKNFLYYFRLTTDNRILFGGRVSFNGQENDALFEALRENMIEVFPSLKDYKVDYRWGGLVGFTRDFFPHIGILEDGTHFALGYCGHGASMSTLMGKLIAANVLDSNRERSRLEKLPLKTVPFHGQRAMILSLAGVYYQILDQIS